MVSKIKIGALISGGGTNLQAIINACESGEISGDLLFVGSDNPQAKGLERAVRHNISWFVVDYREIIREYHINRDKSRLPADFDLEEIIQKQSLKTVDTDRQQLELWLETRAIAEAALLQAIMPYQIDLLVLAGFMRNLTPYFIDRFRVMNNPKAVNHFNTTLEDPRIMNIHPALLPAFPGVDGYGDTWRYGCKVGGCTVHFIDYGEDSGPIIAQAAFDILEEDTLDSIKKKGLELEWKLYPACIQQFAQGKLKTVNMTYTLNQRRIFQRTIVKCAS